LNSLKQGNFRGVITFLLLILTGLSYAQLPLTSVNLDRIHQKKIRELVQHQNLSGNACFSDLKPSCYNEQDSLKYSIQRTSNVIREVIQKVWNKLKVLKPKDEYDGKMLSFGFLYSKRLNQLFYPDDDYKEIEEGEIYYLNLKLLGGIKNIGVALEVTKVDEANKTIQFCYLNNGMSEGTQEVKLTGTREGNTIITQETRYRNRSKFREKKLYPIFHQKAVNELHNNIRHLIEGN
jgi:hypothetical protein